MGSTGATNALAAGLMKATRSLFEPVVQGLVHHVRSSRLRGVIEGPDLRSEGLLSQSLPD